MSVPVGALGSQAHPPTGNLRFDVRGQDARYRFAWRYHRWLAVVGVLVLLVMMGLLVTTAVTRRDWTVLIVAAVTGAFGVVLIPLVIRMFRRTLEEVAVSSHSVTLRYRGGLTKEIRWNDPKLKFRIWDYREVKGWGSQALARIPFGIGAGDFDGGISEEAANAIVSAAQGAGARTIESTPFPGWRMYFIGDYPDVKADFTSARRDGPPSSHR